VIVSDIDELAEALRGEAVWSTTLPRDAA
jgi:phosphoglycolate phosphatase